MSKYRNVAAMYTFEVYYQKDCYFSVCFLWKLYHNPLYNLALGISAVLHDNFLF